jgi:hypothetical protein
MSLALSMIRGKTGKFFLSVFQADGITPQNLSGTTLYFNAGNGSFSLQKSSPSSGITIDDSAGGEDCATLTIDPGDTTALDDETEYALPCELVLVSGSDHYTLDTGNLVVTPNVGTP